MRARVGAPLLSTDSARYDALLSTAREQLDASEWQQAWQMGSEARLEDELAARLA